LTKPTYRYDRHANHSIFAYTSPDESKAYKGQEVISAAPVVPELQFAVADMFA